MPIEDEVFALVPVGEENAVSSRLLWQQLGMWSSAGVRGKLNELAIKGLIRRKKVEQPTGPAFRYYKLND